MAGDVSQESNDRAGSEHLALVDELHDVRQEQPADRADFDWVGGRADELPLFEQVDLVRGSTMPIIG